MNGYDTIRYSIDTRAATPPRPALPRHARRRRIRKRYGFGYRTRLPRQLSLDSEMHLNNGSIEKDHYEIEMIKK